MHAENLSQIDAQALNSIESAGEGAGVTLAFNSIGWKSQNFLFNLLDTLLGDPLIANAFGNAAAGAGDRADPQLARRRRSGDVEVSALNESIIQAEVSNKADDHGRRHHRLDAPRGRRRDREQHDQQPASSAGIDFDSTGYYTPATAPSSFQTGDRIQVAPGKIYEYVGHEPARARRPTTPRIPTSSSSARSPPAAPSTFTPKTPPTSRPRSTSISIATAQSTGGIDLIVNLLSAAQTDYQYTTHSGVQHVKPGELVRADDGKVYRYVGARRTRLSTSARRSSPTPSLWRLVNPASSTYDDLTALGLTNVSVGRRDRRLRPRVPERRPRRRLRLDHERDGDGRRRDLRRRARDRDDPRDRRLRRQGARRQPDRQRERQQGHGVPDRDERDAERRERDRHRQRRHGERRRRHGRGRQHLDARGADVDDRRVAAARDRRRRSRSTRSAGTRRTSSSTSPTRSSGLGIGDENPAETIASVVNSKLVGLAARSPSPRPRSRRSSRTSRARRRRSSPFTTGGAQDTAIDIVVAMNRLSTKVQASIEDAPSVTAGAGSVTVSASNGSSIESHVVAPAISIGAGIDSGSSIAVGISDLAQRAPRRRDRVHRHGARRHGDERQHRGLGRGVVRDRSDLAARWRSRCRSALRRAPSPSPAEARPPSTGSPARRTPG